MPVLTVTPSITQTEGNSGTVTYAYTLTLDRRGNSHPVDFVWSVEGSGANPADANDFGGSFPSGSGTFAPGETEKTISFTVSGDTDEEEDETFTLSVEATLALDSVTATGTITNDDDPLDETPDAFHFTDVTNVALSTEQESDEITVTGLGTGASVAVSVTGGEYSKNGGAYTSAGGTAENGDTFTVKHTSSGSNSTATNTTLTIGGVSDTFTSTTEASAAALLAPGAGWTGTASSGYAGSPPTDPTRTTAKPAIRLLHTPNQRFTDDMRIGVDAGAWGLKGGSDFGIEKVIAYCEGNTLDITTKNERTYIDANGNSRRTIGYHCVLDHSAFAAVSTTGGVDVYFEAIPNDPTMQSRVIGPYRFFPRTTAFDGTLYVRPAEAEIAGTQYQNLKNALARIRTNHTGQSWNIILDGATSEDYDLQQQASTYNASSLQAMNWVVITCAAGKTATIYSSQSLMRPAYDGLCFRGSNVIIDPTRVGISGSRQLYMEDAGTKSLWFDGCTVQQAGGRYQLINGFYPAIYWLRTRTATFEPNYWSTDCIVNEVYGGFHYFDLVRNPNKTNISQDATQNVKCIHAPDGYIDDIDPDGMRTPIDVLTVSYSGGSATATLEKTRSGNTGTLTIRENGSIPAAFNGGAALTLNSSSTVQAVANAINAVSDWTATVVDNTRNPAFLLDADDLPSVANIAATDVKTAPYTFKIGFDVHSDVAQYFGPTSTSITENVILGYLPALNLNSQGYLLDQTNNLAMRDFYLHNSVIQLITAENYNSSSASTQSHVLFENCTWAGQTFVLRADLAGQAKYNPDTYCAFSNCAMHIMSWVGTPDTDLTIDKINVASGSLPSGATNSTTQSTNLYVDEANDDFTPVTGGNLSNGDGTYKGAYDETGAWNI